MSLKTYRAAVEKQFRPVDGATAQRETPDFTDVPRVHVGGGWTEPEQPESGNGLAALICVVIGLIGLVIAAYVLKKFF